jgi:hypothetical protein
MRWMEACYGGTDVMERPCAVARRIDINTYPGFLYSKVPGSYRHKGGPNLI